MMFKKGAQLYDYQIEREGGGDILYINYFGAPYIPSMADSPVCMSRTIDILSNLANVSRIVFVQQRNYNHNFLQTTLLIEIAQLYNYLTKQEKILSPEKLAHFSCKQCLPQRYDIMNYLILNLLKQDPVACYVEAKRLLREEKLASKKLPESCKICEDDFVRELINLVELLEKTKIIRLLSSRLEDYHLNSRDIYQNTFRPDIIPNFSFTRLVSSFPESSQVISQYEIGEGYDRSVVTILKIENKTKYFYHLMPPEYNVSEEQYTLLNLARNVLIEHRPKAEEFTDPERTRQVFFNIARDLIQELADTQSIKMNYKTLNQLAIILVRYTIGFGIIEILLQDEKIQDISVNSPPGTSPIFVRHQDFDECDTNITVDVEDVNSWAAKFRMISGRPLDEANPILDTDLTIGKMRARVAVIQQPLSPNGIAYAFRRHRDDPWTLPLFIKNRMLSPLAAGLLSFLIDGSRTLLVAGTRSAGKTSLLGALMVEIMSKYRVIVVEDSVSGDSKIIVKENGEFRKTTIGKLIDEQIENGGFLDVDKREKAENLKELEVFCVDKNGKVILAKPSKFIRHKNSKQIFEIATTSGKKIRVTEDHSLFSLDEKYMIKPIKTKDIKEGNFLAIPLILPLNNNLEKIDILKHINKINCKIFVSGESIENYLRNFSKELRILVKEFGYKKGTVQNWFRKNILPIKIFEKIKDKVEKKKLFIKGYGSSGAIPCEIILDKELLCFFGLWLADGCYDKRSIIVSVQEEENKEVVRKIAQRFDIPVKMHSDKFSSMINSSLLKEVMQNVLELKGNSYTKKFPQWAYNLSDEQIGYLLKGFFSGDGCASDKEIIFSVRSEKLVDDISTLLLRFGIVSRNSVNLSSSFYLKDKKEMFHCRIGNTKMIKKFKERVGFLVKAKQENLEKLSSRISTHDTSDIIPLSLEVKNELAEILGKKFSKHDYITRQNNIGREHLINILNLVPQGITNPIEPLKRLVNSDIFWDKVKSIKKVKEEGFVYDISVPECENFICENIVAHNTLELPVDALRKLGYDILRMKVRSALLKETNEIAADDGIRTSLRLGDSCLIVGEVRSSIRGNEEVIVVDNGIMKRVQIKDLENKDLSKMYVPTMSYDLKVKLSKLTGFVKHSKRKKLLRIKTKTGREVTVTHDHSLFAPTKNFEIAPIECKNFKIDSQIVIPSFLPCGFNDLSFINVFDYLPEFRVQNFENDVRKAINVLGWKKATEICNINCGDIYNYFRENQKTNIPFNSYNNLMCATGIDYDIHALEVKKGTSLSIPATIPVNENFCKFLGYYVSEGYHSLKNKEGGKIVITNSNPEIIEDIFNIARNLFKLAPKKRIIHGLGTSVQIHFNCLPLTKLISKLGCGRISSEKRVPQIIFGLSKEKIAAFLRGLYSGDGNFTSSEKSGNCVRYYSTSKKLVEDVSYLLLNFGIIGSIRERKQNKKGNQNIWILEFKDRTMVKTFLDEIGFEGKNLRMITKKWEHTKSNFVKFDRGLLKKHLTKYPRKYRHLFRFLRCSRNYLEKVVLDTDCEVSEKLKAFALGDFFLDEVKEIEEIELDEEEYVYDLSVEPTENFVGGFGGILLHNTEAKALYEAMRVGALANVVAGTIHGASAYGVFDRVVNDLQVPITSFKATDIIAVVNPIKTADGMHSWRRLTALTEVRKHWTKDPIEEKGFVDLMRYNVNKDEIEPTADLISGESEILKAVAGSVKGWAGNWDAVWDNITLRAKVKEELVFSAEKLKMPDLLEADFNSRANNAFHEISDKIREEIGLPESKRVLSEWKEWLKKEIKRKVI